MFYVPQIVFNKNTNEPEWYLGLKDGIQSKSMTSNGDIVNSPMDGLKALVSKDGKIFAGKENNLYGGYGFFGYAKVAETKKWKKEFIKELKEVSIMLKNGELEKWGHK